MSELDQLRQEAEQLKSQIRVSRESTRLLLLSFLPFDFSFLVALSFYFEAPREEASSRRHLKSPHYSQPAEGRKIRLSCPSLGVRPPLPSRSSPGLVEA